MSCLWPWYIRCPKEGRRQRWTRSHRRRTRHFRATRRPWSPFRGRWGQRHPPRQCNAGITKIKARSKKISYQRIMWLVKREITGCNFQFRKKFQMFDFWPYPPPHGLPLPDESEHPCLKSGECLNGIKRYLAGICGLW